MNRSALDFRHFVDHLRRQGDLVDVHTEVDANLEIGAITRRVYERRAPAPLFHNIRDSLPGARVLGAPAGLRADRARAHSRLALHFGLPEHSGPRDIVAMLRAAMRAEPIAPRRLERGPVQENVWLGEQVDLTRFPVPLLHEQDGGRYFGTYGFHVVQTPDGSWDSWSVGRLMLVDRNTLAGPTIPTQHIGIIREQWRRQGKPTPWAMALGAPPAALAAAGMPLPEGVSEAGYVGALVGEPVEVVRTQTNGLWVPANAEIVLEGEISLDETALEGPMGEYHGYSFPTGKPQPLFHVHALSFRDQPILPICVAGTPPEENHTIWGHHDFRATAGRGAERRTAGGHGLVLLRGGDLLGRAVDRRTAPGGPGHRRRGLRRTGRRDRLRLACRTPGAEADPGRQRHRRHRDRPGGMGAGDPRASAARPFRLPEDP